MVIPMLLKGRCPFNNEVYIGGGGGLSKMKSCLKMDVGIEIS